MIRYNVFETNPPKRRSASSFFARSRRARPILRRPGLRRVVRPHRAKRRAAPQSRALQTLSSQIASLRRSIAARPKKRRHTKRKSHKKSHRRPVKHKNRGRSAKTNGGRKMATAKQMAARRLFAKRAKSGAFARKRSGVRRNKRGVPLSGKRYRPSISKKIVRRGRKAVSRAVASHFTKIVKRKRRKHAKRRKASGARHWKRAWAIATPKRRKRRKARKHRVARKNPYRVHRRPRRTRKYRRAYTNRAARRAVKHRWSPKRRKHRSSRRHKGFGFRRNPGILGGIKQALMAPFSKATLKLGAGVLIGACFAVGAPTLLPLSITTSLGYWGGLLASVFAAGIGGALAAKFAPAYAGAIVSGGIVVTGLRLISANAPMLLKWGGGDRVGVAGFLAARTPRMAGFLPPAGVRPVSGFLPPPQASPRLSGIAQGGNRWASGGEAFKRAR